VTEPTPPAPRDPGIIRDVTAVGLGVIGAILVGVSLWGLWGWQIAGLWFGIVFLAGSVLIGFADRPV
jgi:hypothetical protein